jgi:hypothetical protein
MKTSFLTLMIASLVMIFGSGISYASISDGLVSAWLFDDGTANDFIGNNNGTLNGNPTFVEGKFNKALSFDGKAAYVNLGDTKNFPNGSSKRTVAFWTLLRNKAASDNYFMCWGECLKGGAFFAPRINADGNISLMVNNTGGYSDIDPAIKLDVILGVWSHLVYTYDGATTVKIYINGVLNHEGNTLLALNTSTGFDAYIGARDCFGGYNNGIDASIDEVGIWNRVLSDDEIASLAKSSIGQSESAIKPSGKISTLWGTIKSETP